MRASKLHVGGGQETIILQVVALYVTLGPTYLASNVISTNNSDVNAKIMILYVCSKQLTNLPNHKHLLMYSLEPFPSGNQSKRPRISPYQRGISWERLRLECPVGLALL